MGIITFSTLGSNGWFGNQLFQYCFAKKFCQITGNQLFVPGEWKKFAQVLFQVDEPVIPIRVQYPRVQLDQIPWGTTGGIDLWGYYQNEQSLIYSLAEAKSWVTPGIEHTISQNPKIVVHRRMGDMREMDQVFCTPSERSYDQIIDKVRDQYGNLPVIEVGGKPPEKKEDYDYSWIDDFHTMRHATVLIRSNSTFAWWAGALGNHQAIYSPLVEDRTGIQDVEFVEGNWPRMADSKNAAGYLTDLNLC